MHKSAFTTSKDLAQYDAQAYTAFLGKLRNNQADWNEFLPNTDACDEDSIILKLNTKDSDKPLSRYIPNPRLFSLKNEFNCGCSYGFNFTDLFSTFEYIAPRLFDANSLKVYTTEIAGSGETVKVIEFTENEEGDAKTFIKHLITLGNSFGKSEQIIKIWRGTLAGRNTQEVIKKFGLYTTALLEDEIKSGQVGKTPYHWFYQLSTCENFEDTVEKLSVFNINFESLISGFEQFFLALGRQKGVRTNDHRPPIKIARQIFID